MKTKQIKAKDYCGKERPARKVMCQLKKGHKGSCREVIFWEDEEEQELSEEMPISNSQWIYVPEIDKEVEISVHDKNKSFDDLKKVYGDKFESMLLTKEECEKILTNKEISKILKMDGSSSSDDFFIQQYNEEDKKKGYVADFYVIWDRSYFYSDGISRNSFGFRGVRFVRKKISTKRKKK